MTTDVLKTLRKRSKLSQREIAKALNVSISTISQYESGGRTPDLETVSRLAELFNVSTDYLLGTGYESHRTKKIRVYGDVAAGQPIDAVDECDFDDPDNFVEIPADMANSGEYFALRIKGDSMAPRIQQGDIVIVRKQNTAEDGDICIVSVNGDNATCKKIKKTETGLLLIGLNPAFVPLLFTWREVAELAVHIIGKVVEFRAKL